MTALTPSLVTGPTASPLDVDLVKAHLRVDHGDDNTLIELYIAAAAEHLDGWSGVLGSCLMPQEWSVPFYWCRNVILPMGPFIELVSVAVDDALAPLADLTVTTRETPKGTHITLGNLPYGEIVTLNVNLGYADADAVPATLKSAMLLHIGELYENREQSLTGVSSTILPNYDALIDPHRRRRIG